MSTPEKPAILIASRALGGVAAVLEGSYTVYRLWEGPPVEASGVIRAVVAIGEDRLDAQLLDSLPALGLIACFTVGYDGLDLDYVRRRGLQATYAPGANHDDVADHALGLILASRRDIVGGHRRVADGVWRGQHETMTTSLKGQKLGVYGLGRIGEALALRCAPLGMQIAWWGPRPKPQSPWPRAASLLDLAKDSDILAVCAPLDAQTRGSVDAEVMAALGPKGLLVNVARGGLVDEAALISALTSGRLGAAALDVFEQEPTPPAKWAEVPHVVLSPHLGGATNGAVAHMLHLLVQNLEAFFAGQPLKTPITV